MKQANQDIRRRAAGAGVKLWQIADALGITDCYFSRLLRKEFSEERRAEVFRIIDELEQEAG